MNKNFLKNSYFAESRLLFKGAEKVPAVSEEDKKKVESVAKGATDKAREKAKSAAVEKGKSEAVAVAKSSPKKPTENFTLPEIPAKLTGLKIDSKEAKINKTNGTIEQPFKFGDLDLKGKIIMPEKPEAGKPVTYLFNYVDDPEKFNNGKFIEELKKRKEQLGNTVIITLKTPEGETRVDQKKVNTMSALMGDIERFQADLNKDPQYGGLKLPRAEKILHMTSEGESEKVKALLAKYAEAAAKNDPRAFQIKQIINNDPDNFAANLDQALNPPALPDQAAPQPGQPQQGPAPTGGGGSGGVPRSAPTGGGGGASSAPASPTDSISGSASAPSGSAAPSPNPDANPSPESKEAYSENLNKLLVLGDSLMVGAQGRLKANQYEKADQQAVGGWAVNQMLKKFQHLESQGSLEKYRNESLVMDGGINDIANGHSAEQILNDMKAVWQLAKKFNMKVYCCTLTPFKGAHGWKDSLWNGYEGKEQIRQQVNDQLIALAGTTEGPYKIIPLHKKVSEGGVADDNDPTALSSQYAAGDKLHMGPGGYTQMAKAIQDVIGQPVAPGEEVPVAKPEAPGKIAGFKVTPEDRQASDKYLAEVNASSNPTSRIGETKVLPGGDKILRVAWHQNHDGQWGTPSFKAKEGRHIGVQVEPNPDAQKKSLS